MDARHLKRITFIKTLFALSFNNNKSTQNEKIEPTITKILQKVKQIDKIIEKYAPKYPIQKISKIDLAVLRLSVFELMLEKKNPPKVIIDEAVELAKEYGNEKSYSFINGVLGSLLKDINI